MGQKKNIDVWVKKYVSGRASREPGTPRDELAEKLKEELRKMNRTPPAKSTMRKMISAARIREPSPQDQPWHLGTIKQYSHAPVGIAAIMGASRFAAEHKATLTIREAKWISRLGVTAQRMYPPLRDRELGPLLIFWAIAYAHDEIWSEVSGEPFNTTMLDSLVATGDLPREQWKLLAVLALQASGEMTKEAGEASIKKNEQAMRILKEWREDFHMALNAAVEPYREEPGLKEAIEQIVREIDSSEEGHHKEEPIKKTGKKTRGKKEGK
jgi:hypothetical protein